MWCVLCGVRIVLLWEFVQRKAKDKKQLFKFHDQKRLFRVQDGNWWHVYGNKTANKVEGTRVDEVLF